MCVVGDDFEEVNGTFEIVADQTDVVVTVPLVDDVFPEEVEQFEVVLLASPGVFISSPASAIITILNDDPNLPGKSTLSICTPVAMLQCI